VLFFKFSLTLELQVKAMTMDVDFIVYALGFSNSVEVQVRPPSFFSGLNAKLLLL